MRISVLVASLLLSFGAFAAETAPAPAPSFIYPYIEGKDYFVLENPVPTDDPAKIEVVEVFSYICPHCFHFDPILNQWMKNQKPDVALVRVHAMWNKSMEPYQRGFYTAALVKAKSTAHDAIFKAIHEEQKELPNAQAWADFLSNYGVTKQAVLAAYDSAAVTNLMNKADERFRTYQISGTPEMVVEGKYRISTRSGDGVEGMLKVVDFLINKSRAERATRGAAKH